jgi:hypothetical protein
LFLFFPWVVAELQSRATNIVDYGETTFGEWLFILQVVNHLVEQEFETRFNIQITLFLHRRCYLFVANRSQKDSFTPYGVIYFLYLNSLTM